MAGKKSASNLEDHAGYWLRYVSNHVSHAFARKVEAQGVTVAEWVLLREMLDAGTANPSQLADAVGMTRGAVSKLVERLCRKELAERHFNLIETLGEFVVKLLFDEFGAPWVKIRIAKIGVKKGVRRVGVYIQRGREGIPLPATAI